MELPNPNGLYPDHDEFKREVICEWQRSPTGAYLV